MKKIRRAEKFLSFFAGSFAFALFADWLAGSPKVVDDPISSGLWAAIIMQFGFWLGSLYCWGTLLQRWANLGDAGDSDHGLSFALGSMLYALIAFLFAALGLLHPLLSYLLWMFQSVGVALTGLDRIRLSRNTALALVPVFFLFLLYLADALVISPYWDPLHHHLSSIRLFWEQGRMYLPRDAIASYQEGGFELLFLWPHFFFAKTSGLGLLPVQIFAQLTHLFVGFGGSLMVANSLAKRWLPGPVWRAIGVTFFAIPASLRFAIPTAKNEWGIILWVLSGFLLIATSPKGEASMPRRQRMSAAGLLWGFAWLAKLTCFFSLAGLSTIFLFYRRNWKNILPWFALSMLAGAAPLAARNFLGTGDPLFPMLPDFFQINNFTLGPTWREALGRYRSEPIGFARVRELVQEFPLATGTLALPILGLIRSEEPSLRAAAAGSFIGFLLFSLISGAASELRLLGPLLPLSALLLAVLIQRLTKLIPLPNKPVASVLLGLLTLVLPYRWESIRRIKLLPYNHLLVRSYVTGEAQGWFRDHYQSGMRAALLSESRFYHSLPLPVIRIWDSPALDSKLRASNKPTDFLQTLRNFGFTHLILSQEKLDLFYPRDLVGAVESFVLQHPESFVFESKLSLVADLSKLP